MLFTTPRDNLAFPNAKNNCDNNDTILMPRKIEKGVCTDTSSLANCRMAIKYHINITDNKPVNRSKIPDWG